MAASSVSNAGHFDVLRPILCCPNAGPPGTLIDVVFKVLRHESAPPDCPVISSYLVFLGESSIKGHLISTSPFDADGWSTMHIRLITHNLPCFQIPPTSLNQTHASPILPVVVQAVDVTGLRCLWIRLGSFQPIRLPITSTTTATTSSTVSTASKASTASTASTAAPGTIPPLQDNMTSRTKPWRRPAHLSLSSDNSSNFSQMGLNSPYMMGTLTPPNSAEMFLNSATLVPYRGENKNHTNNTNNPHNPHNPPLRRLMECESTNCDCNDISRDNTGPSACSSSNIPPVLTSVENCGSMAKRTTTATITTPIPSPALVTASISIDSAPASGPIDSAPDPVTRGVALHTPISANRPISPLLQAPISFNKRKLYATSNNNNLDNSTDGGDGMNQSTYSLRKVKLIFPANMESIIRGWFPDEIKCHRRILLVNLTLQKEPNSIINVPFQPPQIYVSLQPVPNETDVDVDKDKGKGSSIFVTGNDKVDSTPIRKVLNVEKKTCYLSLLDGSLISLGDLVRLLRELNSLAKGCEAGSCYGVGDEDEGVDEVDEAKEEQRVIDDTDLYDNSSPMLQDFRDINDDDDGFEDYQNNFSKSSYTKNEGEDVYDYVELLEHFFEKHPDLKNSALRGIDEESLNRLKFVACYQNPKVSLDVVMTGDAEVVPGIQSKKSKPNDYHHHQQQQQQQQQIESSRVRRAGSAESLLSSRSIITTENRQNRKESPFINDSDDVVIRPLSTPLIFGFGAKNTNSVEEEEITDFSNKSTPTTLSSSPINNPRMQPASNNKFYFLAWQHFGKVLELLWDEHIINKQ